MSSSSHPRRPDAVTIRTPHDRALQLFEEATPAQLRYALRIVLERRAGDVLDALETVTGKTTQP